MSDDTEYENLADLESKKEKSDLSSFLGLEDAPEKEWQKHWVGMPEFVQEDKHAYKELKISFRTKEDYEDFAKIIGQKLTEKTKSIWHPHLDRTKNSLLRWIETDD